MPISISQIQYFIFLSNKADLMANKNPTLQEELKDYAIGFSQVVVLIVLLIVPSIAGQNVIEQLGLTEVSHYMDQFMMMVGVLMVYFVAIMFFHERLISKIHDLIYIKILVVTGLLFWLVYDGYMAYIFQSVYEQSQTKIGPRDIVWSDIDFIDLPADVIYPNFRAAFLGVYSVLRFCLVALFAYKLMTEKAVVQETGQKNTVSLKTRTKEMSLDDIKKNLHPSIMKQYEKNDD